MHTDCSSAWRAGDTTYVRFGPFKFRALVVLINAASQVLTEAIPVGQLARVPPALEGSPLLEFPAADGEYGYLKRYLTTDQQTGKHLTAPLRTLLDKADGDRRRRRLDCSGLCKVGRQSGYCFAESPPEAERVREEQAATMSSIAPHDGSLHTSTGRFHSPL